MLLSDRDQCSRSGEVMGMLVVGLLFVCVALVPARIAVAVAFLFYIVLMFVFMFLIGDCGWHQMWTVLRWFFS